MGKKIFITLLIIGLAVAGYFAFKQKIEIPSGQGPSTNSQPENQPSDQQTAQPSFLQQPKVTVYQGGFIKIEIPIGEKVSHEDGGFIVKSVFAAGGQTYEVYRSSDPGGGFIKIATAISSDGTSYLAVFDRDYPRDSKTLLYRYARLDGNTPVFSEISTADLQQAVDEGHQPWRLDPLSVAKADGVGLYGFLTPCDQAGGGKSCDTFTLVSQAASAGVAEVEATHGGKVYLIELIKPILGDGKIWMIKEVKEKIQG